MRKALKFIYVLIALSSNQYGAKILMSLNVMEGIHAQDIAGSMQGPGVNDTVVHRSGFFSLETNDCSTRIGHVKS